MTLVLTFSISSQARRMIVNTQYLFVNSTDVVLFVLQRGAHVAYSLSRNPLLALFKVHPMAM